MLYLYHFKPEKNVSIPPSLSENVFCGSPSFQQCCWAGTVKIWLLFFIRSHIWSGSGSLGHNKTILSLVFVYLDYIFLLFLSRSHHKKYFVASALLLISIQGTCPKKMQPNSRNPWKLCKFAPSGLIPHDGFYMDGSLKSSTRG